MNEDFFEAYVHKSKKKALPELDANREPVAAPSFFK